MKSLRKFARSILISFHMVVTGANFWLAIALVFCVLFSEIAEDFFSGFAAMNSHEFGAAYFFNISIHFGYFIYAAPLACAFASSGNLINETEAGFHRLHLLRTGKHEYSIGIFIGTTIGGGLALMIGMLLFAVVCAAKYGTTASINDMAVMEAWYPLLTSYKAHWTYMIVSALLSFVFGALWSGIGLTISVYSPVRYVSYLTPFILCFCSTLSLPVNLQPLEMLVQMRWESFSFHLLLAYQFTLYCMVMIWFDIAVERNLYE